MAKKISITDRVREFAKDAPATEIERLRDMLQDALYFRGVGLASEPRRGRPRKVKQEAAAE